MAGHIDSGTRTRIAESIDNHPVGFEDGTVRCSDCGTRRRVVEESGTERFFARVENNPRIGRINVGAIYCRDCDHTEIRTPTQGVHEARVEVEVQPNPVSTPVITNLIKVHDYSSASNGQP